MNGIKEVTNGNITSPIGFQAAGMHAGIRNKKGKYDLCLIASDYSTTVAGTYTQNTFKAAPVQLSKENIEQGNPRGIVVNSRVANACTGKQGAKDAYAMAEISAKALNLTPSEIIVASTGLIGAYLPMDKIEKGIKELGQQLSSHGGMDAASAIMTTDTKEKYYAVKGRIGGKEVTVGGIAKGSGMIYPNMATMLAFISTDCCISKKLLQKALMDSVQKTYNMITVDGDTSTNDMVTCMANGAAQNPLITETNQDYHDFCQLLDQVNKELARQIVLDGEGATKLIETTVKDASSFDDARQMAMAVLNSNLVKTAFFGEDANWGRIIVAMGYSGVDFNPSDTEIYLGDIKLFSKGEGLPFSEEKAKAILEKHEISITISLGNGTHSATGYGSDLSYEYVRINGSYRT